MVIVSDSSPLIAFSRINQIELLQAVVGNILIPEEVAREISEYGKGKRGVIVISNYDWIKVKKVTSRANVDLLLPSIDKGEAEVIILAKENKAYNTRAKLDQWLRCE
jgi:predicted nucleic acid-binding protein